MDITIRFSIAYIFLCNAFLTVAQEMIIEDQAVLFIEDEAILTFSMDVTNNGNVLNNGEIRVNYEWNNLNLYTPGTGVFRIQGQGRTIRHTNASFNEGLFHTLVFDGDGDFSIPGNIFVSNNLNLINGYLQTSNTDFLRLESQATISGGGEDSYIIGPVEHFGNGYRFFPIGTVNNYTPIEFLSVNGIDLLLKIESFEPNLDSLIEDKLFKLDSVRFWQIDELEGSFLGSRVILPILGDEQYDESEINGVVVASKPLGDSVYYDRGRADLTGNQFGGTVLSRDSVGSGRIALALTKEFLATGKVAFPNAFSPNAINTLDRAFVILGNDVADNPFLLRIYDRFGDLVYETQSFETANNEGWDGRHMRSGRPLPTGIYTFILRLQYLNGESEEHTGSINLYW